MTAPVAAKPAHQHLKLEQLSPEAQEAARTRKLSGNYELKPLIRLLGELAHADEIFEGQAKAARNRFLVFLVLTFLSLFVAMFGQIIVETPLWFLLVPLCIVLAAVYGLRYRSLNKLDLINDFRMCLRPVLRDISNDIDASRKIRIEMDLSGPQDRKQISKLDLPPGRFQKLTETVFTDPWCEARLPLADGTTMILAFENSYHKFDRRYRSSRGKIKWKSKWRKDCTATATLVPVSAGAWHDEKLRARVDTSKEKLKFVEKDGVTCGRLQHSWYFKGGPDCPTLAPPGPHVVGMMLRLHSAMPKREAAR